MTQDPIPTTDVETGIDILLEEGPDPWFGAGAGATTMTGGTADAYARDMKSGAKIACDDCDVTGAKSVRANFGAHGLPEGDWLVRIYGTPLGYARKLIYESRWRVKL